MGSSKQIAGKYEDCGPRVVTLFKLMKIRWPYSNSPFPLYVSEQYWSIDLLILVFSFSMASQVRLLGLEVYRPYLCGYTTALSGDFWLLQQGSLSQPQQHENQATNQGPTKILFSYQYHSQVMASTSIWSIFRLWLFFHLKYTCLTSMLALFLWTVSL